MERKKVRFREKKHQEGKLISRGAEKRRVSEGPLSVNSIHLGKKEGSPQTASGSKKETTKIGRKKKEMS